MTDEREDLTELAEKWNLASGGAVVRSALVAALAQKIAAMLLNDRRKLQNALYRLDVNEEKLMRGLAQLPPEQHPQKIAELIVERELQKAATRRAAEKK